jgi:hypothetical protein
MFFLVMLHVREHDYRQWYGGQAHSVYDVGDYLVWSIQASDAYSLPIGIRRTPWLCSDHGGFALTIGLRTPAAIRLCGDGYKPDTRVGSGTADYLSAAPKGTA